MHAQRSVIAVVSLVSLCVASGGRAAEPPAAIRFNRDIRPILAENCFACHGPAEDRGGDLRLDVRADAIADRGSGPAIVPGKPDDSELLRRILAHDPDEVMPPPRAKKPKLRPDQLDLLRRWIAEGAPYQNHWAFEPLDRHEPPTASGSTWGRNPIDSFIAARLRAEGLAPSPEADRTTLLRRVALDITGLQPTAEELHAFLADPAPDAYERAVDRLLASPHYGERWGRHWLDQARYADSNGYTIDAPRVMWPYRDWVIDAVNRDLPFDQFTIEQIAGDLLPNATKFQKVATGFHRNTLINQEGGTKPEQFRCEAAADRVNTTGAVWLGLTVGCAQCHSHKYDPLTQKEYFQLFAFFDSDSDVNNIAATVEVTPGEITGRPVGASREQLEEAEKALAKVREAAPKRLTDWLGSWPALADGQPGPENVWHPLDVEAVDAGPAGGATIAADKRTVVIDAAADTVAVSITIADFSRAVTALKIDFPAEEAEGSGGGAARSHRSDGSFVVSEVSLRNNGDSVRPMLALAATEDKGMAVSRAIDGKSGTGWAPDPTQPETVPALVIAPRDRVAPGNQLIVRIECAAGSKKIPRRVRLFLNEQDRIVPLAAAPLAALAAAIRSPDKAADPAALAAFATVDLDAHTAAFDRDAIHRQSKSAATLVMERLPRPRTTYLHVRGDYLNPDTKLGPLRPDTPAFLPRLAVSPESADAALPTRLDLARWLVRPDNPLTPRVTVNRVWMRYFGTGLVETENDFGTQGSPPTHPELLDWLAGAFIDGGWSLKKLHRLIVTSVTYRQASVHRADLAEKDPRNLLLGRQNRLRLDAEIIRDTALEAAGLLAKDIGGPSVYPVQPEGVYAFTQAKKLWPTATDAQRHRRTLYTQFYRSAPHPLFTTFDAPNFSATCTRRMPSNTPLQSLMLANDAIFVEAANAIGDRAIAVAAGPDADAARLDCVFEWCLARPPTAAERAVATAFLGQQAAEPRTTEPAVWRSLARGILNTDAFVTRE